jgi:hypothetical protein
MRKSRRTVECAIVWKGVTAVNYHVVFDVSLNGSQLAVYALILIFASIFGLLGWGLKDSSDPNYATKGKVFMSISGIVLVLSTVSLIADIDEYHNLKKSLQTGDFSVAEGTVENFVPMPPGGHSTESFQIGPTSFAYGSGWGSLAFNSDWNRGYIHNGARVRIAYKDGNILRVEVR